MIKKETIIKVFSNFLSLLFLTILLPTLLWRGVYSLWGIALVPFFLNIFLNHKKTKVLLHGTIMSVFFAIGGYWWVYTQDGEISLFFLALIMSLFFWITLSYLSYTLTNKHKNNYFLIISIPFVFILLQYFVSFIQLGGFIFEIGSFVKETGTLSMFIGLRGITFLVVALNVVFALLLYTFFSETNKTKKNRHLLLYSLMVFLILLVLFIPSLEEEKTDNKINITVAAIQPNFDQSWEWRTNNVEKAIVERNLNLTDYAINYGAKIVVWPEYAMPADLINDKPHLLETIQEYAKKNEVNLIIGSLLYRKNQKHLNIVIYINSNGTFLGHSGSIFPGFFNTGAVSTKNNQTVFQFDYKGNKIKVSSLICYEEFFPKYFSERRTDGVDLFVVIANNRRFGFGAGLAAQFSKHRAAENNVPLIRASNTGISQIINSKGKILIQSDNNIKTILVQSVLI